MDNSLNLLLLFVTMIYHQYIANAGGTANCEKIDYTPPLLPDGSSIHGDADPQLYQTTQFEINWHHDWVHAHDIWKELSDCVEDKYEESDILCDNCEDTICDLCDKETFPDVTERIVCIGVETYEAIKSEDKVCRHHAGALFEMLKACEIEKEASVTDIKIECDVVECEMAERGLIGHCWVEIKIKDGEDRKTMYTDSYNGIYYICDDHRRRRLLFQAQNTAGDLCSNPLGCEGGYGEVTCEPTFDPTLEPTLEPTTEPTADE